MAVFAECSRGSATVVSSQQNTIYRNIPTNPNTHPITKTLLFLRGHPMHPTSGLSYLVLTLDTSYSVKICALRLLCFVFACPVNNLQLPTSPVYRMSHAQDLLSNDTSVPAVRFRTSAPSHPSTPGGASV